MLLRVANCDTSSTFIQMPNSKSFHNYKLRSTNEIPRSFSFHFCKNSVVVRTSMKFMSIHFSRFSHGIWCGADSGLATLQFEFVEHMHLIQHITFQTRSVGYNDSDLVGIVTLSTLIIMITSFVVLLCKPGTRMTSIVREIRRPAQPMQLLYVNNLHFNCTNLYTQKIN